MTLQEDLVSLEALTGHLEPSDDDLKVMQAAGEEALQKSLGQIGVVNLASKAPEVKWLTCARQPAPGITTR